MAQGMGDLSRATERATRAMPREGVVISNPADETELIRVRVRNADGAPQEYGPMRWFGPASPLPEDGDTCLIVQASNTKHWFALIWPLAFDQP